MIFQDFQPRQTMIDALEAFKKCISSGNTLLRNDSILIFTCGERPNQSNPGKRSLLMKYAQSNLTEFNFFIAEKIFDVFQGDKKIDWLSIEEKLANYSDCIIIILETESTFAELGAFMMKDSLADIVLVVNDIKYSNSDSFINLGPLKKLETHSKFKPVVNTKYNNFGRCFIEIEERLQTIKRDYNKRIEIRNFDEFDNLIPKTKLLFILDLISLFSPISYKELINILKFLYGEDHGYDIKLILSLQQALELIFTSSNWYMRSAKEHKLFFDYRGLNLSWFKSNIMNNYFKYSKNRTRNLHKRL